MTLRSSELFDKKVSWGRWYSEANSPVTPTTIRSVSTPPSQSHLQLVSLGTNTGHRTQTSHDNRAVRQLAGKITFLLCHSNCAPSSGEKRVSITPHCVYVQTVTRREGADSSLTEAHGQQVLHAEVRTNLLGELQRQILTAIYYFSSATEALCLISTVKSSLYTINLINTLSPA